MSLLRFHHVGCAVTSIEATVAAFRPFFPRASQPVEISTQCVRVCFVEMQPGGYIELIEGIGEGSVIVGLLKRRVSFYHLGFLVDSFDQAFSALVAHNYRHLETFFSEAFGGGRCAFLMSETKQIVEIIDSCYDVMQTRGEPSTPKANGIGREGIIS